MKSFIIGKNDEGQRMDKYLTKSLPNLPKSLMYKYLRLKRIKLNGKRAEISARLHEGDTVDLYISDEFFAPAEEHFDFMSASRSLDIVFENESIILLNKKAGLLCHPDNSEYIDTLIGRVLRYLYEKGEYDPRTEPSFTPALANRIDRNTSGIVIAAKTADALREMNARIKSREVKKLYLCVVCGEMPKNAETLSAWLFKDEDKNKVFIREKATPGAKQITTRYRVLGYRGGLSLLEIELLTGRTHQIRAHLAHIGHPLLGDGKYGVNTVNREHGLKKQCLCSYKLRFEFESDAGCLDGLNHREFTLSDVWFEREFNAGGLHE